MTEGADPGTPGSAVIAWVLAVLMLGLVVFLNQCEKPAIAAKAAAPVAAKLHAPEFVDITALYGKIMVKLSKVVPSGNPKDMAQFVNGVDQQAATVLDRLRAAVVAAEVLGKKAGLDRLDALERGRFYVEKDESAPSSQSSQEPAAADSKSDSEAVGSPAEKHADDDPTAALARAQIPLFRRVLESEGTPRLEPAEREKFIEEHGWFARLALSRGMSDTDPFRAPLLAGGALLITLVLVGTLGLFLVLLAGFTCFIIAAVNVVAKGFPRRFVPPAPGGSSYLEMVPLLAGCFVVINIGMELGFSAAPPAWSLAFKLILQWVLLLVCFWPYFRGGLSFADFRKRLGWHGGEGVFKEIGCGIFGYLASIPLLVAAMVITIIIVLVQGKVAEKTGQHLAPPENPIVDLLGKAGTIELALLFVLATCWAPIVEEAVFRGGFYRHLRSRVGMLGAAAISALAFGVMHGYAFLMLSPVITLGFAFALMREWRSSLIASMTGHFLHNATVLTFLLTIVSILRD